MVILTTAENIRFLMNNPPKNKCNNCKGTGLENWNEDGEDVQSGKTNLKGRVMGECEECRGLGFTDIEL